MRILDKNHIIYIYDMILQQSGGLNGIRDERLLDSALKAPFQTFSSIELYPTIYQKAAGLCFGLINNHAFKDGNKRMGILVMMIFMELNGIEILCTDDELIALGLGIADGKIKQEQIQFWLENHYTKKINLKFLSRES
jgi:death-on-curing family protein